MFEYKSDVVTATKTTGILSKNLNEKDVAILDELINKRAAEGWELVTHSLSTVGLAQFIVTFKKEK